MLINVNPNSLNKFYTPFLSVNKSHQYKENLDKQFNKNDDIKYHSNDRIINANVKQKPIINDIKDKNYKYD